MKRGWTKVPISELASVQAGAGFPDKYQGQVGQKIPFYKVSDMNIPGNEREMIYENNSISDKVRRELRAFLFPKGSIIFPKIGGAIATNKKRRTTRDCCVDNNVMGVIPKAGKVDGDLLFYFFLAHDLSEFANEAHLPSIKKTVVEDREITLPTTLSEQRRIVAILDEAFEGIAIAKANAEKNLQNARAIFDSYLESVFNQRDDGWREDPLAALCDIKHGFAFKSEFFTDQGDYVLLTPGNFYESGGYRDRGEKQKYYCGQIPAGYILKEGDLLIAMTEQAAGLLGSSMLVPESGKFLHNQRLGLVTKKPGVPWTNEFFFHVFNTRAVRRQIHDSASGVKVRHTSPAKVGHVIVSFPASLSQQRSIVSQLTELEGETQRLESMYRRKLAALEALKKSLLHHAFAGELTAQPDQLLQEAVG